MFIMSKLHADQHGSHVLPVLVITATIGIVIFVGYTVITKNKQLHGLDSKQNLTTLATLR